MGELAEIISFPSSRIATVVSQRSHDRTELKGPKKVATKRQKRSQGEGSIFPVSGREGYRAQFQREDGSRITKHVKTRQEASDWITAQRVLALKGHQTSANTPKLGEWMDAWMDRRTVSPKTINSERSVRRLYFKKLEHVPLDKLTPGTIKRWLAEIEAEQDAVGMRQVANEPAHRQRQFLDQRGRCDDLFALGQNRMFGDVHDFEIVAPFQMFLANLADVRDRPHRTRRGARDIQPQHILLGLAQRRGRRCGGVGHDAPALRE